MPRSVTLALLILLGLLAACSSDDEEVIEIAPLGISFVYPEDPSTRENPGDPIAYFDEPGFVSVSFDRPTGIHEMDVDMFPAVAAGAFTANSESYRSWTWEDIQFTADDGAYFWLIDGVNLGRFVVLSPTLRPFVREPVVIRIPSSRDRIFPVGFQGEVKSLNPGVLATGALIFIQPIDQSSFNPLDPETFDPDESSALAVASRGDNFVDLPAFYTGTLLVPGESYNVIAIKDTNNDLHYSPLDDWWGYYEVDGEFVAAVARQNTGEKDSLYNSAVDILLRAPVPLPTVD